MTFEKGTSEVYGKQVYEHYLAIDETINVTVRNKAAVLDGLGRAVGGGRPAGRACDLRAERAREPADASRSQAAAPTYEVCGYFFRPDNHEGDTAALLEHMRPRASTCSASTPTCNASGVREFGTGTSRHRRCCPKGTLYIPIEQPLKHWIQAVMGEDPFEPIEFFYDVATVVVLAAPRPGERRLPDQPLPAGRGDDGDRRPGARRRCAGRGRAGLRVRDRLDAGARARLRAARRGRPRGPRARGRSTPAGSDFTTGAALVDASSLGRRRTSRRSPAERQTPVTGLDGYPVDAPRDRPSPRSACTTRRHGGAEQAAQPDRERRDVLPGHCAEQPPAGVGGNTTYCVALFTLTDRGSTLPERRWFSTDHLDRAGGRRPDERRATRRCSTRTARSRPARARRRCRRSSTRAAATSARSANGTTAARNAGITTAQHVTPTLAAGAESTPGSSSRRRSTPRTPWRGASTTAASSTATSSGNPIYDPGTLAGNGTTIPAARPR